MTLATSDRTFLRFDVTALALLVISHHESRLAALRLERMAVAASLILGAIAFDQFSILIDMMAN